MARRPAVKKERKPVQGCRPLKASDYLAAYLKAQGVTHVFELVGGMITHMVDSLNREGSIGSSARITSRRPPSLRMPIARMTGVPGVAMATSGPGATNLLTGIGSCYFDSSPAVFITGQVNRNEQKRELPIRQLGFQETDIVAMAQPITKAAWQVNEPASTADDARLTPSRLALSGRPGPVLLDIPMDVQRADIEAPTPSRATPLPPAAPDPRTLRRSRWMRWLVPSDR